MKKIKLRIDLSFPEQPLSFDFPPVDFLVCLSVRRWLADRLVGLLLVNWSVG